MGYKYDNIPSKRAYKEETADFWEIEAIRRRNYVSIIDINKIIAKEFDEFQHDGIDSEEDEFNMELEDIFLHLQERVDFTDRNYPFSFSAGYNSLFFNGLTETSDYLYLFLLLCTRFNMQTHKVQKGIDGTLLFEHICANTIRNFFGNNTQSYVFGTGVQGSFKAKINDFITKVGEGRSFKNSNFNPSTKNDDGVDIVAWKDFADKKIGKLIGFGQCKTGTTSWRDGIHKLKPSQFCSNWLSMSPVFEPIPIVFLADTMNDEFNFYTAQKGFLVFNRFRIMEYGVLGLSSKIQSEMKDWVVGALESVLWKGL